MTLEAWMKLKDFKAETMASLLGIHYSTVYRIVQGKQMPTWDTVRRIRKLTKGAVMPNDFLED